VLKLAHHHLYKVDELRCSLGAEAGQWAKRLQTLGFDHRSCRVNDCPSEVGVVVGFLNAELLSGWNDDVGDVVEVYGED